MASYKKHKKKIIMIKMLQKMQVTSDVVNVNERVVYYYFFVVHTCHKFIKNIRSKNNASVMVQM